MSSLDIWSVRPSIKHAKPCESLKIPNSSGIRLPKSSTFEFVTWDGWMYVSVDGTGSESVDGCSGLSVDCAGAVSIDETSSGWVMYVGVAVSTAKLSYW